MQPGARRLLHAAGDPHVRAGRARIDGGEALGSAPAAPAPAAGPVPTPAWPVSGPA
nr:hypothetical protein [uncultured Cupriavidus sp.]